MARYAEFYSHDSICRKVAESAGMVARDLPTHSELLPDGSRPTRQAQEYSEAEKAVSGGIAQLAVKLMPR